MFGLLRLLAGYISSEQSMMVNPILFLEDKFDILSSFLSWEIYGLMGHIMKGPMKQMSTILNSSVLRIGHKSDEDWSRGVDEISYLFRRIVFELLGFTRKSINFWPSHHLWILELIALKIKRNNIPLRSTFWKTNLLVYKQEKNPNIIGFCPIKWDSYSSFWHTLWSELQKK